MPQPLQPPRRRQPHSRAGRARQKAGHERPGPDRPRQPLRGHRVLPRVQGRGHSIPILGYEAYVAPGKRTDREAAPPRRGRLPPDAAGQERDRLPQPHQDGLRAPSSKATTTCRASTRSCSRPTTKGSSASAAAPRPSSATSSSRTSWTRPPKLAEWFARLFGNDFYVEIQNNGLDDPEAVRGRGASTSPTASACRWWPPATPTTSAQDDSRPRRAAVHQHRQDCATTRSA